VRQLIPSSKLINCRIIVIDSVTFHFRHDFTDMGQRTRLLQTLANQLMSISANFNVAVVMINQVTTRITPLGTSLVPALGETWTHAATNRIMLYWKDGKRFADLVKSPTNEKKVVPFAILPEGVRSISQADEAQ